MKKIEFTIYSHPFGKRNMMPIKRGRKVFSINPQENKNYMAIVQDAYLKIRQDDDFTTDSSVNVEIRAYFGLQKTCYTSKGKITKSGKMKLDGILKPTQKPDCDNISKAICDALTGLIWRDDSQITDLYVSKRYAESSRVEISITIHENKENG